MGLVGSSDRPEGSSCPGASTGINGHSDMGLGQRLGMPPIPTPFGISKMSGNEQRSRSGTVNGPEMSNIDGNTWWSDVQCPTDVEMKMLSKVGVHVTSTI